MVSIDQTRRKYHGRKAATYDEIRTKQQRWKLEEEIVAKMLDASAPRYDTILDCPVGTGRFLHLYYNLGALPTGIDASEEMLALARAKIKKRGYKQIVNLQIGDATAIEHRDKAFDCAVCVRFLDLIDEAAMVKVVTELCRVTRRAVILTIRLGDTYVPKSNTAEHDRRKFALLVKRLGWKIEETVPIFEAGWVVMRLGRK